MSETMWIERAQKAVGDADTIVAAAWFQPRGTSGGLIGGMTGGNMIAGGGLIGTAVGVVAPLAFMGAEKAYDDHLASKGADEPVTVPFMTIVGVSATRIYAWRSSSEHLHNMPGALLFAYDRNQVAVTVHSRVSVRTFEVEDLHTGQRWEFESPRINGHLKFVVDALHPDQPDEEAPTAP